MDMKENPKLDLASSYEDRVSEEKASTQKISILDHTNGFQYTTTDKSDSFVIDMESFSHGVFNKEMNPNPRITKKLQRSLSRKGSPSLSDRDSFVSSSSPKEEVSRKNLELLGLNLPCTAVPVCLISLSWMQSFLHGLSEISGQNTWSCMPEKPTVVVSGTTDPPTNQQVHHQITITTGSITAATENRFNPRRNSCRRPPLPWLLDPKRILMLFATLVWGLESIEGATYVAVLFQRLVGWFPQLTYGSLEVEKIESFLMTDALMSGFLSGSSNHGALRNHASKIEQKSKCVMRQAISKTE
ncbi:hypothetical protein V6N11_064600 [Hibiscus sabdariffa]|uniref:Uncharacterized protein n=1 Tax=Hibiscus sabdariffa TaxID=183260 RepID=A0ABR2ND68_9ROSI